MRPTHACMHRQTKGTAYPYLLSASMLCLSRSVWITVAARNAQVVAPPAVGDRREGPRPYVSYEWGKTARQNFGGHGKTATRGGATKYR